MIILSWILVGTMIGFIAGLLIHQGDLRKYLTSSSFGMCGALLGGLLFSFFRTGSENIFDAYNFLVSVAGAISLLIVYRTVQ